MATSAYDGYMAQKQRNVHTAADFNLDVMSGDTDLFRWFLLCYLFGKPIRSESAVTTWKLLIDHKLDTPWAINEATEREIVSTLLAGGYMRYQHVTARGLKQCMEQLIRGYDGSLIIMIDSSENEDIFKKQLQTLYGVGPTIAAIVSQETEEFFAQRVE
jgi:endonuclease III